MQECYKLSHGGDNMEDALGFIGHLLPDVQGLFYERQEAHQVE